jgi:hypothetical protein
MFLHLLRELIFCLDFLIVGSLKIFVASFQRFK